MAKCGGLFPANVFWWESHVLSRWLLNRWGFRTAAELLVPVIQLQQELIAAEDILGVTHLLIGKVSAFILHYHLGIDGQLLVIGIVTQRRIVAHLLVKVFFDRSGYFFRQREIARFVAGQQEAHGDAVLLVTAVRCHAIGEIGLVDILIEVFEDVTGRILFAGVDSDSANCACAARRVL